MPVGSNGEVQAEQLIVATLGRWAFGSSARRGARCAPSSKALTALCYTDTPTGN
jgi:hypothetical protein